MPQGDHTCPIGLGPRTGRGLGYCGSGDARELEKPCFDPARRRRGRGGQNWRHRYSSPTREETLQMLKSEADWLKGQLESIKKNIEELEQRSTEGSKS